MSTRRDALMALMAPGVVSGAQAAGPEGDPAAVAVGLFRNLKRRAVPEGTTVVQTSGYAVPGVGAARYVATSATGETRARTCTRDGRWFELAETEITPQMFGAMGGLDNKRVDDTAALQAWLDFLRDNLSCGGHGRANLGRARLPAGTYLVTRSLDLTSHGAEHGGRTIVGDDEQNTILQGELVEPYPVLDATNAYSLRLEGFQIRCTKASKASCCILLAQDRDEAFITYNNSLERLRLWIDYDAPNAVAALVVQNNDLLKLSNVKGRGPVGLSIGWRLPVLRLGQARGGGPDTLALDAAASAADGAYVGHPVRLVAGAGAGTQGGAVDPISRPAIGRIVAYDGASRTARVDRPWLQAPDATTAYEVYAIASKFAVPQSHDDATHYALNDSCTFTGKKGVVITGVPGTVDFGDTYVASEQGLDADACAVLIASMHPSDARLGPIHIYGRNFCTENQSGATPFAAIKSASPQIVSIDLQGTPIAGPLDPAAPSVVFADVNDVGFRDLNVQGRTADEGVRMFAVGGAIRSLRGSMHCMYPGEVKGGISRFDFDWQLGLFDKHWIPFVLSTCRHVADTGAGPVIPAGARVQVPGLQGGAWATQGYTLGGAGAFPRYGGGGRAAAVASWTIPGGALAIVPPVTPTLRTEIAVSCLAHGAFSLRLRQEGGVDVALTGDIAMAAGQRGLIRFSLQHGAGGFHTLGELRFNKAIVAEFEAAPAALSRLDAAKPFRLEIEAASAAPNPLAVTAQLLRVE